jgi:cytochrome P450
MLLVSAIFFGVFTTLIVKFFFEKWKLYQINIPQAKHGPKIVEYVYYSYLLVTLNMQERFELLVSIATMKYDWAKVFLGFRLMIVLISPEKIHKVLNSPYCLEKFNLFYDTIDRKGGLIFGSVKNNWKLHRKILNVTFSKSFLESYTPTYEENAQHLIEKIEANINEDDEFDFFKYVRPITLNIVLQSTTGQNVLDLPNLEDLVDAVRM